MAREITRTPRSQPPTQSRSSSLDHLSPDSICNLKHNVRKALAEVEGYEGVTKCSEDNEIFGFAVMALENAVVSYREFVADAEPDDIAIDEPNEVQRSILKWYDEYAKRNEAAQASEPKKPDEIESSANANGNAMDDSDGDNSTLTPLSVETDDNREGDVAARGGRGDNRTGSSEGSDTVAGEVTGSVAGETTLTPRRSSRKRTLSERAEADADEDADADGETEKSEGDEEVDELDASDEEDAAVGATKVETGKGKKGEDAKKATKKRASAPRKPRTTSNSRSKPRVSRTSSAGKTSARTAAATAARVRNAQSRRPAGAGTRNAARSRPTAPRSKEVKAEVVLADGKSASDSPGGRKTKKPRIDSTEEKKDELENGDTEYKPRPGSPQKPPGTTTARKKTGRAKANPTSVTAADADTNKAGNSKTDTPNISNTSVPVAGVPNPKPASATTLQENIHNVRLARDALLGAYNFASGLRLQAGSKSSKPKPESGAYWQADAKSKLYDSLKLVGMAIADLEMMEVDVFNEGLKGSQ